MTQRRHEDWLYHKNSTYSLPAKVLVIDGTLTKEGFERELSRLEPEIFGGAKTKAVPRA